MANPLYHPSSTESAPSQRLCQAAVFVVAVLLVVGLTQFIATPFDAEPAYDVTWREGVTN